MVNIWYVMVFDLFAEVWQKSNFLLIKSDCTRIRQLFDRWIVTMLKNLKTALFQTFSTWHRILSAFTALYWPSTAFYWPSTTKYQPVPPYTDPVPSYILFKWQTFLCQPEMSTVVRLSSFYLPFIIFFGTLSKKWIGLVEWVMLWLLVHMQC